MRARRRKLAYKIAKDNFIKDGNNRVILATDGDFNVGITSEKALGDLITKDRQTGVYLTCLGVGMGNYKDSKIEALAKKGNGNFAYLDDIREAEKVLVTELTQNLYTVAHEVYLNAKFNPATVKEYRLIGYDNKKNLSEYSKTELEGGEVGSGNGITAIFEIIPINPEFANIKQSNIQELASITLHYRLPDDSTQKEIVHICANNFCEFNALPSDLKFAEAVAEFGLMLRHSKYLFSASWDNISTIAKASANPNDYLQNEFISLVEKSKKIYSKRKRKRSDD